MKLSLEPLPSLQREMFMKALEKMVDPGSEIALDLVDVPLHE